jgi:hypothetical protein
LIFAQLAFPGAAVQGQDIEALERGARVRVETSGPGGRRLTGVLDQLTSDRLVLYVGAEETPSVVPRRELAKLEVSRGRATKRAAWLGAVVGGVAGSALAFSVGPLAEGVAEEQSAVLLGGLGALLGAGVGAAVGSHEQWREVPLGSGRVTVAPFVGRANGVAVAVRF